jgi:hypothetical protein
MSRFDLDQSHEDFLLILAMSEAKNGGQGASGVAR